jgi:hypothetical protein
MKIVRRIDNKVVVYCFADDAAECTIDETGMHGLVRAADIFPESHEIITGVEAPPADWVGNAYSWDGSWVIADQPLLDRVAQYRAQAM